MTENLLAGRHPPALGAVLVDQIRSIDRGARRLRLAGEVPQMVVVEVQAKLAALFGSVS